MISVLIVDDHKIFRQGISLLLKNTKGISIVGEAGCCKDAYGILRKKLPDLAILDVSMPDGSGIDLLAKIKKAGLKTKSIMLTMHKDGVTASRALKNGACGYLLKDSAYEELSSAIEKVMAGEAYISPPIAEIIEKYEASDIAKLPVLTRREKEVLCLVAEGKINREIAEVLFLSIKTVETHRTNIMKKLDIHRTADLVRYAIKMDLTSMP